MQSPKIPLIPVSVLLMQSSFSPQKTRSVSLLNSLREHLESTTIKNAQQAHFVCSLIPARCPFERKITLKRNILISIPPLCKLNPFYEEVSALRFKALTFLAEAGEDVSQYC